jgi:galactokinase
MSGEPTAMTSPIARARAAFVDAFGEAPASVAVAPGRVNLIGEHTDYNDGFVLPMAIDRVVAAAFRARSDRVVRVHAPHFAETCTLHIDETGSTLEGWSAYVAGVLRALAADGLATVGADITIVSNVPIGAGLSSSAALELATARALCAVANVEWRPVDMARLAQRAEREHVGVACGIMDQFASAMGVEGAALLLDCRSLEARSVPLPSDAAIVIMDTGVRRALAASDYNSRRDACQRAVAAVKRLESRVTALRDVTPELLSRVRDRMDEEAYRRAQHVVAEIHRPPAMAACLEAGDLAGAGRLMNESHASLRDLYGVSCTELDAVTAAAREQPGCHGARLTGAGFGGCAIAIVAAAAVDSFMPAVIDQYRRATSREAALFMSRPAAGARLAGDRD